MPETFQALLAVALLGLLGLGAGRLSAGEHVGQGRAEADLRALGVATRVLDRLAVLPFDAAGEVATASELTSPAGFGGAATTFTGALDLDDVHAKATTVSVARDGEHLPFVVSASVRYVEPAASGGETQFEPAADRTFHKEVVVFVTGPLGSTLTLGRVYAYDAASP